MKSLIKVISLTIASILLFASHAVTAGNGVNIRPISDFVEKQGTFCIPDGGGGCFLFVPPLDNFIGSSDPKSGILAAIDYAGIANNWVMRESGGVISFGTSFSGTVRERPLLDGSAEVQVILRTKNALTWAVQPNDDDGFNGALAFGHRAPDVLNDGAEPTLCDSHYQIRLINTAPGAPLPDLLQVLVAPEDNQEIRMLHLTCTVKGETANGAKSTLKVEQTGLFMTPFKGAVADGFPAETVQLHPNPYTNGD